MLKCLLFFLFALLPWYTQALPQRSVVTPTALEIKGAEGLLADNIRGYLKAYLDQPFSKYEHTKALKSLEQAMQAVGYYHASVTVQAVSASKTLQVVIVPGEPMRWSKVDIRIDGEAGKDSQVLALLQHSDLQKGSVVRHDKYEATKEVFESALLERGYFDFKWLKTELRIDKGARQAEALLWLDAGRRYAFGEVVVGGDTKAKNHIRALAPFQSGTPFETGLLSDYNLALNATPYFLAAKVYPSLKKRANGVVPIRVEVIDKPANSYEVGGGYSTDLGAKARLKWSKPWLTDDGHFLESNLTVSQHQHELSGSYTIPVNDPINDVWRVTGGYQFQNDINEGIDTAIWNLQLQRQWLTEDDWVRTAYIKREHETTTQNGVDTSTEMLLPGISYAKKHQKGGALPYWGNEWLYSAEFSSNDLFSSTSLIKLRSNSAWLRSYRQKHLFFARLDLGAIVADDIRDVPFNMRFFAGGDQSIRGFSYQSVAPKDGDEIIGGKYLVTGTLEYNYQFAEDWRGALFVDGGTATNDFSEKWSVGAGVGLRYLTLIGPIRLDLAWDVSDSSHSARLSIVIGPEI